jgi:hypothetical protein
MYVRARQEFIYSAGAPTGGIRGDFFFILMLGRTKLVEIKTMTG